MGRLIRFNSKTKIYGRLIKIKTMSKIYGKGYKDQDVWEACEE